MLDSVRNIRNTPGMFCLRGALKNFAKLTGKQLHQSLFFNKVEGLMSATSLKKRLLHRYFPLNFEIFLITQFVTEHLQWAASVFIAL